MFPVIHPTSFLSVLGFSFCKGVDPVKSHLYFLPLLSVGQVVMHSRNAELFSCSLMKGTRI